jgi:hypothetical protein
MAGLIPPDYPITINGVSGYSGGGREMIEAHDRDSGPAFELYALGLEHKHVPETQLYSGLTRRPIFVPAVGHFRQGMLVSMPLHLDTLPGSRPAAICAPRCPTPMAAMSMSASSNRRQAVGSKRRRSTALTASNYMSMLTKSGGRRCWWGGSTISVKVPRAQQSRTSD